MLECLNETERGLIQRANIVIAFALDVRIHEALRTFKRADTKPTRHSRRSPLELLMKP